jgi:Enoyl-CoA hydratase/isomerase
LIIDGAHADMQPRCHQRCCNRGHRASTDDNGEVLEIDSSELIGWLGSPGDVDTLRSRVPLLVVHDDGTVPTGFGAVRGVVTVAVPRSASPPGWGDWADLNLATVTPTSFADALAGVVVTTSSHPQSAVALVELLRVTEALDPHAGLVAESATYSMLQGGAEHRRWLASRRHLQAAASPPAPAGTQPTFAPMVALTRSADQLTITLNAYSAAMRDDLVAALELVAADPSMTHVSLDGSGPSFCSGGDLDEFGTTPDPATAHRIRLDRSAAALMWSLRNRLSATVHGACIGAGIELAAVARNVAAEPQTWFQLPEVSMGLVPGAGGTVSLTKRIGRQRTAWLALTGTRLDAATALAWGLVDAVLPAQHRWLEPDRGDESH